MLVWREMSLSTLQEMTEQLIAGYDPERIILFGSRARGTHRPDSDFDLLVLKETEAPPAERRMQVERLLADRAVAIDIDVLTPEEMLRLYRAGAPLIDDIVHSGKVLYMRDVTSGWIEDAVQELETAQVLLAARKYKGCCFHAQQATEKALKAMLLEAGEKNQRVHDLMMLKRSVEGTGAQTELSVDDAVFLGSIYKGRYPSEEGLLPSGAPSAADAERAVAAAAKVVAHATRVVSVP
jgi:HEPN domain-containing protein/predicted nucleotidyltransferase